MNLAEEKKEPLRSKDLQIKRGMVVQWLNKTSIVKVVIYVYYSHRINLQSWKSYSA